MRSPHPPPPVPDCRDPHHRPLLEPAAAGRADLLVSGDRNLLALAGQTKSGIVTLADFLPRLRDNSCP